MTTERELIAAITRKASFHAKEARGIGDDCAIFAGQKGDAGNFLVTMDSLVEGVHFDFTWHPPELLGRKAAAVNLSDIAAMGGTPLYGLLSLALTEKSLPLADAIVDGLLSRFHEYNVRLVGGDTVRASHELVLTVTLIGGGEEGRMLLRSGARPGDLVVVTGYLGQSAAGLELCRRMEQRKEEKWRDLMLAHLDPEPQVKLGRILSQTGLVSAMMDLSDGIATDLAHLCMASGVGAILEEKKLPLSADLFAAASTLGKDPILWALEGGEDYHLLFTVAERDFLSLERHVRMFWEQPLFPVGRITGGQGVRIHNTGGEREISFKGYDHFGGR